MKTLLMLLISFISLSLAAQNVNVTFAGANQNRKYQIVIDGNSYYSDNAVSNANGRLQLSVPNLTIGSHNLDVFVLGDNNTTSSNGNGNNSAQGEPAYSKAFQLRSGYDMDISVRANGLVSFTEIKAQNESSTQSGVGMNTVQFNQLISTVRNKRYQSEKIALIRKSFTTATNKFTSSQVRQLLLLVTSESKKLELAKLSYRRVTDSDNFTTVYDVLKSEAGRDSLDDYVVSQGGTSTDEDDNAAYGHNNAMSATAFNQLLLRVQNQSYQDGKITEVRNAFNSSYNYFSTAQIKQLLVLIDSETERSSLAKLSFTHTTDRANFNQVVDLFYTQYIRDDLNRFIVNNGGIANTKVANNNTGYKTAMTDASFNQIYSRARSHFFQKNTLNEIRNAFNTTSNNFSTAQVRQLLMLASAETDRLAMAKLSYPRVVDVVNFPQLQDLFAMQSNRTELDIFIKAQVK